MNNTNSNVSIVKISTLLIICLVGLPQISETIYTPSLPEIADSLKASAKSVEWTLSIYFLGFALGVGFWGKISDHIGRRKTMLLGLSFYCLACVGCFFSSNIEWLYLFRFIQAVGASTGSVITMTIIRDLYFGKARNQIFYTTAMALALSPAIGPLIGGFVVQYFQWKVVFIVLFSLGLSLLLASLLFLPETHPSIGKHTNQYKIKDVAKLLFKDKQILVAAFIVGGFNGILFSYYAEAPFIFINLIKYLPEQYGMTGLIIAFASLLGTLTSKRMNLKLNARQIILKGCFLTFVSMLVLTINAYSGLITAENKPLALVTLLLPMMFFFVGFGMTIPNVLSIALSNYQHISGTAGSIFGVTYYILVGSFLFFMGIIHNGTIFPMPVFFLILSALMFFSYYMQNKYEKEIIDLP